MLCLLAACRETEGGSSTSAGKQRFAVCRELGPSLIAVLRVGYARSGQAVPLDAYDDCPSAASCRTPS